MEPFIKGVIKIDDCVLNVKFNDLNLRYMWGDYGLEYLVEDDKIICNCDWLKVNGKSIKGLEIKSVQ